VFCRRFCICTCTKSVTALQDFLSRCRYSLLGNGSLVISRAFLADSGVFQCFASNVAGEVTAAIWLRVTSMHLQLCIWLTGVFIWSTDVVCKLSVFTLIWYLERNWSACQFLLADAHPCFSAHLNRIWHVVVSLHPKDHLPPDVTSASTLSVFRNRLKSYLFSRLFPS